ncbi:MAG: amidohydrolase family protein [Flavisolibacter sp.]
MRIVLLPLFFIFLFFSFSFSHAKIVTKKYNTKYFINLDSTGDSSKKDIVPFSEYKELPLKATRKIPLQTNEGTWTSVDVSPDGKTIIFDMMGDLYTIPFAGGVAKQITKGIAFDSHPRFSPDGKRILFLSDRSGSDNLWYIDLEKKDTVQLTKETFQNFTSATWTPDGEYIVYAKGKRILQLYMIHKNGGGGVQLTDAALVKAIDPAVSSNGRYIYYSTRFGSWNYNAQLPQYEIGVYDTENAKTSRVSSRYGSAFTPVLSPDGKWLIYGSRFEDKTGLVVRNLQSGAEKWLAYPVQRDDQESIATMGVLPGMAFTPDSKSLIASFGGKIHQITIEGGLVSEIPFIVNGNLEVGPEVSFKYPVSDSSFGLVTQIRDAVPSPDGKKLAFTALDRLYIMDYPGGKPRRITTNEFIEAKPTWAPDGNSLVFCSWNNHGGSLYKIAIRGPQNLQLLTKNSALYRGPVFNPSGDRIVFLRTSSQKFSQSIGPFIDGSEDDICWISERGGPVHFIDNALGRYNPHFVKKESERIYLNSNGSLLSIKWDGTDEKTHAKITGITTVGVSDLHNKQQPGFTQPSDLSEETEELETQLPSSADLISMSPTGTRALAQINNEIYMVTVPKTGKPVNISVADANNAQFPARKLTEIGGEFPMWEQDGKKIHWSLGNTHWIYDLDKAQNFDDSLRLSNKTEEKRKEDSLSQVKKDSLKIGGLNKASNLTLKDTSRINDSLVQKKKEDSKFKVEEKEIMVYYERDKPKGKILLKNGRVISMKGDEVIENADVLIVDNRIKLIGKTGSFEIPEGTKVMDMQGKTILPGFVDVHAHMWPQWGIHKNDVWIYAANLAYGVTTTRDPQTATTDVLTYADLVDAGKIIGPRIFSTGPGVGFWMYNIKDSTQAEKVLQQYSKYFHTHYIKMYLAGNRQQRQWIIQAARNQSLMPTTEGGLDFKLNLTNLLDGYPGHEHAIPIYPLYNDVINTIAATKMIVTPTLLVAYGGPWAENYFYETEKPYEDKKLQYFTPYSELAQKTRRRGSWFMEEEHVFKKHAKTMNKIVNASGLAGIGSHGQLQGLGYHWELWAMQSGGMSNHNALKVATLLGATGLGLDKDLGSLEPGKLADLLILDKNPLENIRYSNTILYVIKNGKIFDANTCNEVYPNFKKYERKEWINEKPVKNTSVIE